MRSNRFGTSSRHTSFDVMEMSLNKAVSILKETFSEWMEDQAPTLGAALAYYTVFSLAHLLIIAISISGLVFGNEVAQGQIFNQLRGSLGDESGRRDRSLRGSPPGYFHKFRVSRLGQHQHSILALNTNTQHSRGRSFCFSPGSSWI